MAKHQRRLPLADERAVNSRESARLEQEALSYTKVRRASIILLADEAQIGLTPVEMDKIYIHANGVSQGELDVFETEAAKKIAELAKTKRPRVLDRWFDATLDRREKARLDVADWYEDARYVYVDIEATGLTEDDVPIEIAMVDRDGEIVMELYVEPVDGKNDRVYLSKSAKALTGYEDDDLWQFQPIENYPFDWGKFESMHVVFLAYQASQDRNYLIRALKHALTRHPERNDLQAALKYIGKLEHWLDAKDTLVEAIGLSQDMPAGRLCPLQDVARATRALPTDGEQEHTALADARLLATIVRNIRQEIGEMGEITGAAQRIKELNERIQDLERQLEAKTSGRHEHHEARSVLWTDIIVGVGGEEFPINYTIREGLTAEDAAAEVFEHIKGMLLIRNDKRVSSFAVGLPTRSKFVTLKPKPDARQMPPPPADPPAGSREPEQRQAPPPRPAEHPPAGSGQGERKSERGISVALAKTRKGEDMYLIKYLQGDGNVSPYELEISKPEYVERLEALLMTKYDISTWQIGHAYPVAVRVSWEKGKEFSAGKFYRDNMQFEFWE